MNSSINIEGLTKHTDCLTHLLSDICKADVSADSSKLCQVKHASVWQANLTTHITQLLQNMSVVCWRAHVLLCWQRS